MHMQAIAAREHCIIYQRELQSFKLALLSLFPVSISSLALRHRKNRLFVYGATLLETRARESMTCYLLECKAFVDSVGTETANSEGKFLFCAFAAFSAAYMKGKTANCYVLPVVTKEIEMSRV